MSLPGELRRRLRRADLLLLHAVRRMRARPQQAARGTTWGALITDDEVEALLIELGELRPLPDAQLAERRLDEHVVASERLRDEPGPRMDALRERHGLQPVDVDLLLLALLPDVAEGYGRVLGFLHDFAVMPWMTVDLAARVLAKRRTDRLAVTARLLPDAPLVRGGLISLIPLDPQVQPFAAQRLRVSPSVLRTLMGTDEEERPSRTAPRLVGPEGAVPPAVDPGRSPQFQAMMHRWRDLLEPHAPAGVAAVERLADGGPPPAPAPRPAPPQPATDPGHADLARRLVRADIALVHAIRLHRELPWIADAARARDLGPVPVITEREVDELLWHRGELWPSGPSGLEARLEATRGLREGVEGRVGQLALRCGLLPEDVDLVLLALLPEIAHGYRRAFAFLNGFLHEHLTVGLATRILGEGAEGRQLIRARLSDQAPLITEDILVLQAIYPNQDYLSGLRVGLSRPIVEYLLGGPGAPGREPGRVYVFQRRAN